MTKRDLQRDDPTWQREDAALQQPTPIRSTRHRRRDQFDPRRDRFDRSA